MKVNNKINKLFVLFITLNTLLCVLLLVKTLKGKKEFCVNDSLTRVSGTKIPRKIICSGDLIFEDNFDNFDLDTWQHEVTLNGGGNFEFEWYVNNRSVSFVEEGVLHIKPLVWADEVDESFYKNGTLDIYEDCTSDWRWGCKSEAEGRASVGQIINPVKSARIRTLESFSFKYGVMEVRAQLPKGDWLWPAIWMLPSYNFYSQWPASGTIVLMESRGNVFFTDNENNNVGTQQVSSILHVGPDFTQNVGEKTRATFRNPQGFHNDFHVFKLKWTPEGIFISVDDTVYNKIEPPEEGFWEIGDYGVACSKNVTSNCMDNPWRAGNKMAPFDQKFHLIINLAVGGSIGYFPDEFDNGKNGGKPWHNGQHDTMTQFYKNREQWYKTWKTDTADSHLKIDYVKVWAL